LRLDAAAARHAKGGPATRSALKATPGELLRQTYPACSAILSAAATGAELNLPRDEREQGVIPAAAYARAGVKVGAVLPHDDLACADELAAEPLHAEPLSA